MPKDNEKKFEQIEPQQYLVHELVLVDPRSQILEQDVQDHIQDVVENENAGTSTNVEYILDKVDLMKKAFDNKVPVVGNGKFTDYSWDAISTLKLLAYRKELSPLIASRSITRKHVFLKIADLLKSLDHRENHPTAEQCDNKWKWLKRKYLSILAKLSENPEENAKNCKFQYFKEMDEIMKIENRTLQIQITKQPTKKKSMYAMDHSSNRSTMGDESERASEYLEEDNDMDYDDYQWDKKTMMLFLDIKKELDELHLPKDKLFVKIADLLALSLPRSKSVPTSEQCETRWRWLIQQYNYHLRPEVNEAFPYSEKLEEMDILEFNNNTQEDNDKEEYLDYALFSSRFNGQSGGSRKRKRTDDDRESLAEVYSCVNEANRDQKDRQFGHMVELMQARTAAIDRQTDVLKEILEHFKSTTSNKNTCKSEESVDSEIISQ